MRRAHSNRSAVASDNVGERLVYARTGRAAIFWSR